MDHDFARHELAARVTSNNDPLLTFLRENRHRPVSISLAKVDRLDTHRFQTIIIARKQWREENQAFELSDISTRCARGLILLGSGPEYFHMDISK